VLVETNTKASFKDNEGNDVKEYIHTFRDGDPPELLIEFEKQLLKLGDRYDLFENGSWKILCQIGGRALEGQSEKYWTDIVEGVHTHSWGDSDVQRKKFKKLIQKVNSKYLGKDAIEEQCDAMEYGDLTYDGHDHTSVMERLFEINEDLELFGKEVGKFTIPEKARRVIPNTLKNAASLRFYDKGGEDLRDANEIIKLCRKITTFLKREHNVSSNRTGSGGQNNRTNSKGGNSGNNSSNNSNSSSAPCKKHDGAHLWKDCPDNWRNPNRNNANAGTSSQASNSNSNANSTSQNSSSRKGPRGEVKSTENQRTTDSSPMVRFDDDCEADDESACSSHASWRELMEIVGKAHVQNLHPITIITLLGSNQKRVACKALLDQCCTDRGLISWDMANMLNHPTTTSESKVFATVNGTFSSNATLKLENAMLPCLSTNRTFTIELM
jgi:hypothetical protein